MIFAIHDSRDHISPRYSRTRDKHDTRIERRAREFYLHEEILLALHTHLDRRGRAHVARSRSFSRRDRSYLDLICK